MVYFIVFHSTVGHISSLTQGESPKIKEANKWQCSSVEPKTETAAALELGGPSFEQRLYSSYMLLK